MSRIQKYSPFLICFTFLLFSHLSKANESINLALKSGNALELGTYFSLEVDLTITGKTGVYSKSEAISILKAFFQTHEPSKFTVLHQGKSAQGTNYSIGKLETENGDFRVSIYTKKENGKTIIQQLNIEE